jgi:hypothetical protein
LTAKPARCAKKTFKSFLRVLRELSGSNVYSKIKKEPRFKTEALLFFSQ